MKILRFAKLNGVTFKDCGPGWDGRIGYSTPDAPGCAICGFKSRTEAAEGWLGSIGLNERGISILRKALEKIA